MSIVFSPLKLRNALIEPLEYMFTNYAPDDLKYDKDVTKTKIEIGTVNDFHKVPVEAMPRIMIDRGPYAYNGSHLNEDLSNSPSPFDTKGLEERNNHAFISGQISVMIEAREEGVCEVVTDIIASFLTWTSHQIAREYGFKSFAKPMNVGSCAPFQDGETNTSFRVVINVPYSTEERWRIFEEGVKIKNAIHVVSHEN